MTKKLNKKGTSLVELIAVIVIMGIIAAIAVPTTIGVINRQKKNAAVKSAENVFNSAKTLLLEAATGTLPTGVTAGTTGDGFDYKTSAADMVASGDLEKNPLTDSTVMIITLTGTNTFDVSFGDGNDSCKINGVEIIYTSTGFKAE